MTRAWSYEDVIAIVAARSTTVAPPPSSPEQLIPPFAAYQGISLTSPVVFDVTPSTTAGEIKTFLDARSSSSHGILRFPAGEFSYPGGIGADLRWTKIEGAGKWDGTNGTVVRSDFDPYDNADIGDSAKPCLFGTPQGGPVAFEHISFENWRGVTTGRIYEGFGANFLADYDVLWNAAPALPDVWTDGLSLYNVGMKNVARLIHTHTNRLDNIHVFHCDFERMWTIITRWTASNKTDQCPLDWEFYDCHFKDILTPDYPGCDWQWHSAGITPTKLPDEANQSYWGKRVRAEQCTWNGVTVLGNSTRYTSASVLDGRGLGTDCGLFNCWIDNLGRDSAGNNDTTAPLQSSLAYMKGEMVFENIVVRHVRQGGQGIIVAKGGNYEKPFSERSYPGEYIRRAYFEDVKPSSVNPFGFGENVNGIIGFDDIKDLTVTDLIVKDAELRRGGIVRDGGVGAAGPTAHQGTIVFDGVTVEDTACFYDSLLNMGGTKNGPTDVTINNVKARLDNRAGTGQFQIADFFEIRSSSSSYYVSVNVDPLSVSNIDVEFYNTGFSGDTSLLRVLNTERSGNDPGTTPPVANLTAEPTGRITGTAGGSLYTQSGSGITNQILDNPLADGAVAGADTDWLPAELGGLGQLPDGTPLHIGCHSDRFRLNP